MFVSWGEFVIDESVLSVFILSIIGCEVGVSVFFGIGFLLESDEIYEEF